MVLTSSTNHMDLSQRSEQRLLLIHTDKNKRRMDILETMCRLSVDMLRIYKRLILLPIDKNRGNDSTTYK